MMDYDSPDFIEKHDFIEAIMVAVEQAGYPNPGYYVDIVDGIPCICDINGTPRQSVNMDSPTAMIVDLAEVIRADR